MPDLLLELFSEEIPARMQGKASDDLKKLVTDALVERGITYESAGAFSTPRRLTLTIAGLPARQPDVTEERKGPRVGAPEAAIQGFLKAAGLASIDQATIVEDKKGASYVAIVRRPGRSVPEVLGEIIPAIVRSFPWPKSQRWGSGTLRWIRPLHSILCVFGAETEETEVVPFEIDGIVSGNTTRGHRFMAPAPFVVKRFDDYVAKLEKAFVILDPARRREIIRNESRTLCFARGFELVEDEAVIQEAAGLVEWPVPLMGSFEERFLAIPPEVIQTTIRANQKCFVVRDPKTLSLVNHFVAISNLLAEDSGAIIIAGNARVIRARLSDAKFFYETDLSKRLESRLPKFDSILFHAKLGTQGARIQRLKALSSVLAPLVGADASLAVRAAELAKADLATEVVGEFPELQGLMGRYYATAQGEDEAVAAACEDHYRPQGPSDRIPKELVSIAVAMADKLDSLAGFWAIDEKPTGSKDPYALRRAALGVIRIVLEKGLRVRLKAALDVAFAGHAKGGDARDLLAFFHDRLRVYLRESGARHDLAEAVFALPDQEDLLMIVRRVEALGAFLDTEDGSSLLAGYRRAANILKAEEKKDGESAFTGPVDQALLVEAEEKSLAEALRAAQSATAMAVEREDFSGAMTALSGLRKPVDAFFAQILVNAPEADLRRNRLRLLNAMRTATLQVADFGKIEG